jgi:hypothetical protein
MIRRKVTLAFSLAFGLAATASFTACSSSSPKGGADAGHDSSTGGGDSGHPDATGGNDTGAPTDSGGASDTGTPTEGGGNDSGSNEGGSNDGGGNEGGNPGSCTAYVTTLCTQMSSCDPIGLQLSYGDMATCVATLTQDCGAQGMVPHTSGLNDQSACVAALTASCASYFETLTHTLLACREAPGTLADQAVGCGYDSQCVAGDYCDLSGASFTDPRCMQGMCNGDTITGSSCNTTADCNNDQLGDQCVTTFAGGTSDAGDSDGNPICQQVSYGAAGADCAAETDKQCQTGFYCSTNFKCAAVLSANAVCDPTISGECDQRAHLSCDPTMAVCIQNVIPVPSGAQCDNTTNGATNICDGNLYCDTSQSTPTCKPQQTMGQGCVTTTVGECVTGLHCAGPSEPNPSTCQPAIAAVCM